MSASPVLTSTELREPLETLVNGERQQEVVGDTAAFPPALANLDDDIIADFAAVGIVLSEVDGAILDGDAVKRHAAASTFMRLAAEAQADADRLAAQREAQVALIDEHYSRQIQRMIERATMFERFVTQIAREAAAAGDFGRKKSAETPFGTFGVKLTKAGFRVTDNEALTAHVRASSPEFVHVTADLTLADALQYLGEEVVNRCEVDVKWGEYKRTLTEVAVPPGVTFTPARDEPFVSPSLPFGWENAR